MQQCNKAVNIYMYTKQLNVAGKSWLDVPVSALMQQHHYIASLILSKGYIEVSEMSHNLITL